jgi:hypothetical protein
VQGRRLVDIELQAYWILVSVILFVAEPILEEDGQPADEGPSIGYYRNFGVTAESEAEACEIVLAAVDDGDIDWNETEVSLVVPATLDAAVVARAGDWTDRGIWFKGGRVLFGEEGQE